MWVLIIMVPIFAGHSVVTQEFTSQFKCQTAWQLLKDAEGGNWYKTHAFCVEK